MTYSLLNFFPHAFTDKAIVINDMRDSGGRDAREASDIFHGTQALTLLLQKFIDLRAPRHGGLCT